MLRKFLKHSITGYSAIQDFVKFENHGLTRVDLTAYQTSVTKMTFAVFDT